MIVNVTLADADLPKVQEYAALNNIKIDEALSRLLRFSIYEHANPGHVYIARSGDRYKIGHSRHAKDRVRALATKPRAEIVMLLRAPNRRQLESILHKRFSEKRIQGEWFALDDADLTGLRQGTVAGVVSYTVEQAA